MGDDSERGDDRIRPTTGKSAGSNGADTYAPSRQGSRAYNKIVYAQTFLVGGLRVKANYEKIAKPDPINSSRELSTKDLIII